ncbi:hypothetical protein LTR99_008082 [Exophiala xenobiotica]|uniref:Zn(2)-C6 fungal-type domain-containing protein n=1 Tax=Vermiconidia calcicola TaxID=1690605 RepID=A0AAV9QJF3_9PEZI|nr:hypothetical protein LTR92_003654 [Exophiala xenobiotica]KAK5543402.1 hypothetical protein LTR25_001015 [Vermiconidia calcicola]KAK5544301.1 hypothetical protein LTR23_004680 [Chaetothyriales sp. CCFEE 6169]KAK5266085.1 hypothetical protein LTR96_008479 [Exophiala xenobiotica]KAK5297680.1 hypothetical protein LTR99_008082 [Exophiala xenobiotica]
MDGQSDMCGGRVAPDAPALDCLIGHKDISSSHPALSNKASSLALVAQSALDLSNSSSATGNNSIPYSSSSSFATSNNTSGDGGSDHPSQPPQPPRQVYARSTASGDRCARCILHKKKCDGVRPVCGYCASSRDHKYDCEYPPGNPSRRQLQDMRRQQGDAASGAGGQQTGNSNNSTNTPATTAPPSTNTQPGRFPLFVSEPRYHLSRIRQAHIAADAARQQAGNNTNHTSARAPRAYPPAGATIHPLALHARQPIPLMANRQQQHNMPPQTQVMQGMMNPQGQGVGLQGQLGHLGQPAIFQASQAHRLMPPPMFMSTNVVEIARQEPRLLPDGTLTFQPAMDSAMAMTATPTATTNMTNSMGGQYPARFPDMNWGPHDVYLSDGSLNTNPPHGDGTSETLIGQLDAPVRHVVRAVEQGERGESEDEEVASSSGDEEDEVDVDEEEDEEMLDNDEDDVDQDEHEESDEDMLDDDE